MFEGQCISMSWVRKKSFPAGAVAGAEEVSVKGHGCSALWLSVR